MAVTEMDYAEMTSTINPVKITSGVIGTKATVSINIELDKKYFLATCAKSTDTSNPYNNMYFVDNGTLVELGGYNAPSVSISANTISMYNSGSSVTQTYYLAQLG